MSWTTSARLRLAISMIYWIALVLWLAIGLLDAGFFWAHFNRAYGFTPKELEQDTSFRWSAYVSIILGPIGMLVSMICRFTKCGWLAPWKDDNRA